LQFLLRPALRSITGGWYTNLPDDPNYLYAAATDTQRDLQLAVTSAKQAASNDITRQIESKSILYSNDFANKSA
jgi:hypothetical protein